MGLFSKMFGSSRAIAPNAESLIRLTGADRPLRPEEYGYVTFTWSAQGGETLITNCFISEDAWKTGYPGFQSIIEGPRLAMLYAAVLQAACYHAFARRHLRASDAVIARVEKGFSDGIEALQIDGKPLPVDVQKHLICVLPHFRLAIERDLQASSGRDPRVVDVHLSEKVKTLFGLMARQHDDARGFLEGQTVTPGNLRAYHLVEATCDSIFKSLGDPEKLGARLVAQ